ncbi:MAG: cyanophycinase [Thermoplasmata archaeon]
MDIQKQVLAGILALIVVASTMLVSLPVSGAKAAYEYYVAGNADDVVTPTTAGLLLAGGSYDVDDGMKWMISRSGGGDFVVIRCAGTDAYNPWIYTDLGGVDSCETIITLSSEACYNSFVIGKIRNAEALFIAGGDQWDYVSMWKGTPVEDAIHFVASKPAPVGGTSAGLAILGEFAFAAENGTITSKKALDNPFNRRVSLSRDFLTLPNMESKITDSHFSARDRMGRLVTFLARIVQDGWAAEAKGIGVNEQTALGVDPNGDVTLFGLISTSAAYFLRTPGPPEVCTAKTPLTYTEVSVYKISYSGTFNLVTWEGAGGTAYLVSAMDGVMTSTLPSGELY